MVLKLLQQFLFFLMVFHESNSIMKGCATCPKANLRLTHGYRITPNPKSSLTPPWAIRVAICIQNLRIWPNPKSNSYLLCLSTLRTWALVWTWLEAGKATSDSEKHRTDLLWTPFQVSKSWIAVAAGIPATTLDILILSYALGNIGSRGGPKPIKKIWVSMGKIWV